MSHHLPFSQIAPQDKSEHGYRIRASKSNFPILQGTSLYKLVLYPKSAREPHWHANADELGYCLKGELLVSLYANHNQKETFIISQGEAFFIPSGAMHSLENIGKENAELLLQFSHEEPEDFELSLVFNIFSNSVLGNTWALPSAAFEKISRPIEKAFIAGLKESTPISNRDRYLSIYQYALEKSSPLMVNEGGSARAARQNVWPILQKQALFSLRITEKGMREPHWHPETAELGYVASGKGKMSLLSSSGKAESYEMNAGDLYFIPKAYPHHIENLQSSDLHLLIFFTQSMPQDIGFTGSVKSFSNEILSAVFHTSLFKELPTYYEDLFISKKLN